MATIDPARFSSATPARSRQRLREIITLIALSAAFLFIGAIALGLLV